MLKSAEGNPDQEFLDALGKCKDAIGEWHDWEQLVGIAGDMLDHGRGCKLIAQLRSVSQRKFETALGITNEMRGRFALSGPSHIHRRLKKGPPKKQPGLESASAIARRKFAS